MSRVLPCNFKATPINYEEGKEKVRTIWYSAISLKLPRRDERLFMLVVKEFAEEPMMLLTTCRVNLRVKESMWRIVDISLNRWKWDESL